MNENSNFLIKTLKELKSSCEVVPAQEETFIIVVAIHKNKERNYIARLNCKNGIPIGGYIYDSKNDTYQIECFDYCNLGNIPISYFLYVKNVKHWKIRVPMSYNLIQKFLTLQQKKDLKSFKRQFKADEFDIQYIQMIDPN